MQTLVELRDFIESDPDLSRLKSDLSSTLPCDRSHDIEHSLRVALWTCRIGGDDVLPRIAVAAAFCHDLVNYPKNSSFRVNASSESSKRSRELLPRYGFDSNSVSDIADAIRDHSFSHGAFPDSVLGRALQDADRLDALGAIGIFRNLNIAIQLDAKFFDPIDPWAEYRPLDDNSFAIDHYFTKLLKLPSTMCTDLGRREAKRRIKIMTDFLDELSSELMIFRPQIQK